MRLLDTRTPQVGACPDTAVQCTRLSAGSTRTVQVAGRAGLSTAGINAVVVNVIATGASGDGHLVAHAAGGSGSDDGRVYFSSSAAVGATVIVPVAANGRITIGAVDADTDVVIDVQGYFSGAWNTSSYTYDGTGLRQSKTTTDGQAQFSWDRSGGLSSLLVEHDGTSESVWIYGPGGIPLEQINPNGVVMFLHHDQLGSIRTITTPQGWEVAEFAYDPYGNVTHATGTARTPFGYAGQYTDFETGNQYLRARYYDPSTGTFLSRDPIEAITGEAYGYVGGNPTNATDPSGLTCMFWSDDCDLTGVADFAGGTLNTLSLGFAKPWIEGQGVDLNSTEAFGGSIVGVVTTLPLFITYPSAMAGASTASSGFSVLNECALGSDRSGCASAVTLGVIGLGVPWFANTAAERGLLRYAEWSPDEFRSLWGWFINGVSGVPADEC